jgi:uncharacterized protein (DUF433 family)
VELESYFEFLAPDGIRIKGTRIGIETVLDDYLNGASPEGIAARYRNLTLEQVYATIVYYLHHQEQIDAYLEAWRRHGEEAWLEQQRNPPPVVKRLQALKTQRAPLNEDGGGRLLIRIRYLLDEDTPHAIRDQLLTLQPNMEILAVGDERAPLLVPSFRKLSFCYGDDIIPDRIGIVVIEWG